MREAWGQPDPPPEGIPLLTWGQLEKMTLMEDAKWHEKVSKGLEMGVHRAPCHARGPLVLKCPGTQLWCGVSRAPWGKSRRGKGSNVLAPPPSDRKVLFRNKSSQTCPVLCLEMLSE